MSTKREQYLVGGVDLFHVRNRNEKRVAEVLHAELEGRGGPALDRKSIMDIYAYALNQLPARYSQSGTIVLRDPVRREAIRKAVRKAITIVLDNPKP